MNSHFFSINQLVVKLEYKISEILKKVNQCLEAERTSSNVSFCPQMNVTMNVLIHCCSSIASLSEDYLYNKRVIT